MTRLMNCVAATLVGAVVMSVTPALAQETRAATTTTAATTAPSAEAKQLIESVKQAYSQLKSLKMAGQMAADIDIAGKVQKRDTSFSAEYESPNLYRHSVKDEIVAGSTGKKVYVLELKRNVYVTDDAPQSKVGYRQLPEVIGEVLEVQDPGLLLAVSANSISDLLEGATKIQKAADTTVDQQTLPTLSYTASDGREISLAFDPQSHLLRQAVYNMSGLMRSRGAEQVNRALITIQYNQLEANGKLDASRVCLDTAGQRSRGLGRHWR